MVIRFGGFAAKTHQALVWTGYLPQSSDAELMATDGENAEVAIVVRGELLLASDQRGDCCYQVLQARGDVRAERLLTQAYTTLHTLAAQISDAATRQRSLEQLPDHRAIIVVWTAVQGQAHAIRLSHYSLNASHTTS